MAATPAPTRDRLAMGLALLASFVACSSGGSTGGVSLDDGGATADASTDHGHPAGDSGGSSSSGSGSGSSSGGDAGDPCEAYADKAYGCCQSEGTCGSVTRQNYVDYCHTFYAACQVYYSCFFAASTCAQADQCPTLGDGGCS